LTKADLEEARKKDTNFTIQESKEFDEMPDAWDLGSDGADDKLPPLQGDGSGKSFRIVNSQINSE
jgi:hypothetical protein